MSDDGIPKGPRRRLHQLEREELLDVVSHLGLRMKAAADDEFTHLILEAELGTLRKLVLKGMTEDELEEWARRKKGDRCHIPRS